MPKVRPSEEGQGREKTVSGACGPLPVSVLTGQALEAWVAESCRSQGVPLQVTDARTVARVLTLLSGRSARSGPGRPGRADARSKAPDQPHPFRVEVPCPGGPGADDAVVEDGVDNGTLPIEIETRPLGS